MNENATSEWGESLNTTQGQNKYGYNYHHIDQRTEGQHAHPPCVNTKFERQQTNSDVYAEFTTDAQGEYFQSDQSDNLFDTGANVHHSLDDAHFKCQFITDITYMGEPMSTSELQYSQHEGGKNPGNVSARLAPEGYVHFVLSR